MKSLFHIQVQKSEHPGAAPVVQEHSTIQTNEDLPSPASPYLHFTGGSANWRFDISKLQKLVN